MPSARAGRLRRALTLATLTLALAGCVTDGSGRATSTSIPGSARTGDIADDELDGMAADLGQRAVPVAVPASAAGKLAHPGASELIGADKARLTGLLGEPRLRRREAPAEIWLYADNACVLHVYLYRNAVGAYRVAFIESRRRRAGPGAEACIGRLIDERRAARAS